MRLLDLSPALVSQARALPVPGPGRLEASVGDARRLPWPDASCDAVLLLGPLYHLTERESRLAAVGEAARVLRPGGRLLAAGISRFASLLDGLREGLVDDPAFRSILERDLRDGQHRNPTGTPAWFTTAYFHRPEELREEVAAAGFRVDALLAVEGPGWLAPDFADRWRDDEKRRQLLDWIRTIEAEPSLLGASAHFVVVGRRP